MAIAQCTAANKDWAVETVKLRAAAARTKGDTVRIGTGHTSGTWTDISIADDTNLYRVAVVLETVASGAVYEAATRGTVDVTVPNGTYVVGDGVKILDGALAPSAAAATAPDDLAANISIGVVNALPPAGGVNPGSIRVTLHGDRVTATT